MQNFQELSYQLHQKFFQESDHEAQRIQQSWLNDSTVDYWRHFRMLKPLRGLLKHYPASNCVTIGDGRFGLDSIKLKKLEPSLHILPTDIAPDLLLQAKALNLIDDFKVENAECLSFDDNQFDLSFCIEAYHHFPRPLIALYEMIRVSRRAVILVEPNDIFPRKLLRQIFYSVKEGVQKLANGYAKHPEHQHFEESGNYVFTLSKREIEKVAIGLQFPMVAFYFFNDFYEKGVEFEKASTQSSLFKKVRRKIKLSDLKCRLGLSNYGNMIAIIFKEKPGDEVTQYLNDTGFDVVDLPKNPHLTDIPAPNPVGQA